MVVSNPLSQSSLEIALDDPIRNGSSSGDDILVMNDVQSRSIGLDNEDHCCYRPICGGGGARCCPKVCGGFCPPICVILFFVIADLYLMIGLNFLANSSTVSPMYNVTAGWKTNDAVLVLLGAGIGSFVLWFRFFVCKDNPTEGMKRENRIEENRKAGILDENGRGLDDNVMQRSAAPARSEGGEGGGREDGGGQDCSDFCESFLKKFIVFMLIYLIFGILCVIIGKIAMYPGMFIKLGSETPPSPMLGEEFTFEGKDNIKLNAYHIKYSKSCMEGCMDLPSSVTKVYPIVMLGGNGGSGWFNVEQARDFVKRKIDEDVGETIGFDVFSFSYRCYEPNEDFSFLLVDEATITEDALKFFEYVKMIDDYFGTRPILLAHSIGTGPASYCGMMLKEEDVACLGLGMPFASGTQLGMELSFYAPNLFFWAIDRWASLERISSMDERIPFLALSAGQDELIAPHHQEEMYEKSISREKLLLYYEEGGHMSVGGAINNVDGEAYDDWFGHCLSRVNIY